MKKNITIAIDDRLAREARILAAKKDTSVSGLLADFLESIVENENRRETAKNHFFDLAKTGYDLNYSQRTFDRNALHER